MLYFHTWCLSGSSLVTVLTLQSWNVQHPEHTNRNAHVTHDDRHTNGNMQRIIISTYILTEHVNQLTQDEPVTLRNRSYTGADENKVTRARHHSPTQVAATHISDFAPLIASFTLVLCRSLSSKSFYFHTMHPTSSMRRRMVCVCGSEVEQSVERLHPHLTRAERIHCETWREDGRWGGRGE